MIKKQILGIVAALAAAGAAEASEKKEGVVTHGIYGEYAWCQKHFCPLIDIVATEGLVHRSLTGTGREQAVDDIAKRIGEKNCKKFLEELREVSYEYKTNDGKLSGIEKLIIEGKAVEPFRGKYYAIDWKMKFKTDGNGKVLDTELRIYPRTGSIITSFAIRNSVLRGLAKLAYEEIRKIEEQEVGQKYPVGEKIEDPAIYEIDNNLIYGFFLRIIRQVEINKLPAPCDPDSGTELP